VRALIVEDSKPDRDALRAMLKRLPGIHTAGEAAGLEEARRLLREEAPNLVFLDIEVGRENGFDLLEELRGRAAVVFTTVHTGHGGEAFDGDAVDYIVKPALRHAQEQLASANRALQGEVVTLESGLQAFAAMGDALGKTGAQHTRRIQRYVELLATAVAAVGQHGHSAWADEAVRKKLVGSAALYDLGKLGLPEDLLLKPGMLTPEERARMQTHAEMGAQALQGVLDEAVSHLGTHMTADSGLRGPLAFLTLARDMALSHHEHWDGQGYPLGLSGEQIPASARLVGFADVYDALLSRRPHKAPWGREQVREYIVNQRGRQFDPAVVEAFEAIEPSLYDAWLRHSEDWERS